MALIFLTVIAGMWIVRGRERWAWPGLVSATLLWIFGVFGGHLWNVSRGFRGSGIPHTWVADTSLDSPAANAFLWASAGSILGTLVMAGWLYLRRERSSLTGSGSNSPSGWLRIDIMKPTWLVAVSGVFFVAWALGQGLSLWSRDTYLAADGIDALLTATITPAPMIGATALAASLAVPASRRMRAITIALGGAWWICTLAVGTRLAVAFPLAVLVAIVVRLRQTRPTRRRLLTQLALAYVVVYLAIYSFGITLEVRGAPHGILRLPELFAYDGRPGLFFLSWGPIVMQMVSSVASSYLITNNSVLHPPPAEVLWMNANPLPQSIAGIDAYSHERMWPYSWVPLSMVGEWYGVYGPVGQLALFGTAVLIGSVSVEYLLVRNQRFFAALALVLAIATIAISIQYPSRWFWRLLSLSVALPLAYACGTWMLRRARSSFTRLKQRRQEA